MSQSPEALADPGQRPTVVAVIDGGINPYHELFARGNLADAAALATTFGAEVLDLEPDGDFTTRSAADRSEWESMENGVVYAFNGTRALVISFAESENPTALDVAGHGTQVAGLIAREDPEVLLVAVRIDTRVCAFGPDPACVYSKSIAKGIAWAAEQAWIDIIVISLGAPGNPPSPGDAQAEAVALVESTRAAADAGKIVINAAGNEPTPTIQAPFTGPPWVICVGGAEGDQRGDSPAASRLVDVVANNTELVVSPATVDAYETRFGTSLAAPIVAGAMSRALREARELVIAPAFTDPSAPLSREGAKLLRDALNASARPWSPTEWAPSLPPVNGSVRDVLSASAPVLVPAAQQGWGYVDGSTPASMVEWLTGSPLPPHNAETVAFMQQYQTARERYWDQG